MKTEAIENSEYFPLLLGPPLVFTSPNDMKDF